MTGRMAGRSVEIPQADAIRMKRVSRVLVVVAALLMVVPSLRLGAQVVRGVVRDSATGAPMPGVIVALDEAVAQLDTDGSLRRASQPVRRRRAADARAPGCRVCLRRSDAERRHATPARGRPRAGGPTDTGAGAGASSR